MVHVINGIVVIKLNVWQRNNDKMNLLAPLLYLYSSYFDCFKAPINTVSSKGYTLSLQLRIQYRCKEIKSNSQV